MAKKQRVSFLEPVRSVAVDYACPKCYRTMYGLTCDQHGTFVLCRRCGAAQAADHKCLADEPVRTPTKTKRPVKTLNSKCIICGAKIIRGQFCANDKKWQMRYYSNRKRGMLHEDNLAKILQQASLEQRVNGMLDTAATMDISEALK